jgi:hypothetical protein
MGPYGAAEFGAITYPVAGLEVLGHGVILARWSDWGLVREEA